MAPDTYADIPAAANTDQAAAVLNCSKTTVRKLIAEGQLRTVRLGRLLRIPRAELIRILEGQPVDPA